MTAKPAGQMPELLPCPFCGEQTAEISEHDYANQGGCGIVYGIICDCGATAGSNYMKKEYAIEAWNRRALPAEWEQRKAAPQERPTGAWCKDSTPTTVSEGSFDSTGPDKRGVEPTPTPAGAAPVLWGPEKQAYLGGPVYRKGVSSGAAPLPAPDPAGGMPEHSAHLDGDWESAYAVLLAHAEQLQARVKEVEHERDTHYTRLGGLLFFGALDAKTVAECRLWAHEYSDWKKRAGQLQERVRELERLVYVPGLLKCAKCKLVLVTTNLHVNTGQVSANNEPQKCPNGCGPMWRLTERDSGNDLCDRLEQAEARLREARKLMIGWKEDDSSGHYDRLRDIDAALAAQGGDKEGEE